jgi:predicted ribosome quality control (RQC) complex YloA/Tae2 family protein
MAFDGITAYHLIKELNTELTGCRIRKIYQPEDDEIILSLQQQKDKKQLLISANNSNPRMYLTQKTKSNPQTPPTFCMSLRKHLANGRIINIYQHKTDRIIMIDISKVNELEDTEVKTLIVEIMGRHSNILLIDKNSNTILDSIKKIGVSSSRHRQILPGKPYILPPENNRKSFLETGKGLSIANSKENISIKDALIQNYLGISPLFAYEVCFRANLHPEELFSGLSDKYLNQLNSIFAVCIDEIKASSMPQLIFYPNNKLDFSTFDTKHIPATEKERWNNISEMLENFYYLRDKYARIKNESRNLEHNIKKILDKNYKKLKNLHKDFLKAEKHSKYQLFGDLITSNAYKIKKGLKQVELDNFYSENNEKITIHLKENLTPIENAQKYYKQYNKAKKAFIHIEEQKKIADEEIFYLEGLLNNITHCTEPEEIIEIKEEFNRSSLSHNRKISNKKSNNKAKKFVSKPLHFISSEGFDIFVGKNNYQNDYISTKIGSDEDCWLHTKNIPGSHVLIIANDKFITEQTVLEGGQLAAYFSKGKHSENVAVDYTEHKYVKKPNNAKPGMVIYTHQNTMFVTPNADIVNKLKQIN